MAVKGAKSLLDRINKLKKAVEEDVPKAIESLVVKRGAEAETGFANADYDGTNHTVVDVNDLGDNTWSITATGPEVLFIEYGSGITYKHDSGFGSEGAFGPGQYGPRSWSLSPQGKKWLSDENIKKHHGAWPYGGHWTYGNPSNNVMFNASKALRTDAEGGKMSKPIHEALK